MKTLLVWINLALALALGVIFTVDDSSKVEDAEYILIVSAAPESLEMAQAQAAANAFERTWGRSVAVMQAGQDSHALARALKRAMTFRPAGISMPGHHEADVLMPFIVEAQRRGIRVTMHSVPLPEAEARFSHRGTGYVGTASAPNGAAVVQTLFPSGEIDPARRILVIGVEAEPRAGSRLDGCMRAIRERGGRPDYLQVEPEPPDSRFLPPDPRLVERLTTGAPPEFIIWDAGIVGQLTKAMEAEGIDRGTVDVTSFVMAGELPRVELLQLDRQYGESRMVTIQLSLVQLEVAGDTRRVGGMHIPILAGLQ